MSEQLVWNTEYLLREAQALAATREEGLASKHFWLVADRDMSGDPPKELLDLKTRAENYLAFDLAFIKHSTNKSDPDVAAADKRIENFQKKRRQKSISRRPHLRFPEVDVPNEFVVSRPRDVQQVLHVLYARAGL